MQKIFVALLSGAVEQRVLAVIQAIMDFIYYAQFQVHTTTSLCALQAAFNTFYTNKNVFIDTGVHAHFNILKLHSMLHYLAALEEIGTADSYSTELSECLHIDFTKVAYQGGNHKDYIANMTRWCYAPRNSDNIPTYTIGLCWLLCHSTLPPQPTCHQCYSRRSPGSIMDLPPLHFPLLHIFVPYYSY